MRHGKQGLHPVPDYINVVHENQVSRCGFSVCCRACDEFWSSDRRPEQNSTTELDISITARCALTQQTKASPWAPSPFRAPLYPSARDFSPLANGQFQRRPVRLAGPTRAAHRPRLLEFSGRNRLGCPVCL